MTLWRSRLGVVGCWGAGVRLEICEELGTLLLSYPPPSSPYSLALALQGDRAEMCPELGDSRSAHGAES